MSDVAIGAEIPAFAGMTASYKADTCGVRNFRYIRTGSPEPKPVRGFLRFPDSLCLHREFSRAEMRKSRSRWVMILIEKFSGACTFAHNLAA